MVPDESTEDERERERERERESGSDIEATAYCRGRLLWAV
jgi:hypothetical protein